MSPRRVVLVLVGVLVACVLASPAAWSRVSAAGDPRPPEEAAEEVMAQLASADGPINLASIEAIDELGPPPWLSMDPDRDDKVVEAWVELAKRMPAEVLVPPDLQQQRTRPVTFTESEAGGETGLNDVAATGDRIDGFGTGDGEERAITISGSLSGAEVRPPPDFDCLSAEDDGAIPLANPPTASLRNGTFCAGEIGDGPHGATTGDVDFFSLGEVQAGATLALDVAHVLGSLDPVETVVGIYDANGTLLASAEDTGGPEPSEFLALEAPEAGTYYGVVASCCELPADPFDPASGAGVAETGTYEVLVAAVPLPCMSSEDDGAIPLANDAARSGSGDSALFFSRCTGQIGDGPHTATGDLDFYTTREMAAGRVLVVDFGGEPGDPSGEFEIGIYDSNGALLASGRDDPDPAATDVFQFPVPADATYHVAIGGALPADPFDPASGADVTLTGDYLVFIADVAPEVLDPPTPPGLTGLSDAPEVRQQLADQRQAVRDQLAARRTEMVEAAEAEGDPVVDVDFFLVDLEPGDVMSGGFDDARVTGIVGPDGEVSMSAEFNPSLIYPADSPLRHDRRNGFDHVATAPGTYAVFVSEGLGAYEGELRVTRAGRADEASTAQQTVFLDFDGADVSPDLFGGGGVGGDAEPEPARPLSPLSAFLDDWGLAPDDLDPVIDATIDAVIETLDSDLRIVDARNGDRDRSGLGTEFDIEILNSRDHGDRSGDPDVTHMVIGGTIEELGIQTIGIAQSIDPGNTDSTETGVVLLDQLSAPAGDRRSVNTYPQAAPATKAEAVGFAVGHITAHEIGHLLGNWHTESFNGQPSLMDAGGEFETVFGVGPDGTFGTADDLDPDLAADVFHPPEGLVGVEDTAGRSAFGLSTGRNTPVATPSSDS